MKIVKVNDNLLINIEQIYSLEKINNNNELLNWDESYNMILDNYYKDPPEYVLTGGIVFKPNFEGENDPKLLEEYMKLINDEIIQDIGNKPTFFEYYKLILSTGLQITIDKNIYDKIEQYLQKYIDKND